MRELIRTNMNETQLLVLLDAFKGSNSNTQTFFNFYSTTGSGIKITMEVPFVLSGQAMINNRIEGYRADSISSHIGFPTGKSLKCDIWYDYEEGEGNVYFGDFKILFRDVSVDDFFNIIDKLPQLDAERKRNRAELYLAMAEANSRFPKEIWDSIDNMME